MWVPIMIVAAAVVMVVGPIMLMQPTNLQRRQSSLRQYAIEKGLRVQLKPAPAGAVAVDERDMLPVYTLPVTDPQAEKRKAVQPWLLVKRQLCHDIHFSGHWDWFEGRRGPPPLENALRQIIDELPADVIAIGAGPQGSYLFWGENGNKKSIDKLLEVLVRMQGEHR